jgi:single-strand DNA-binding protein
MFNKVILVGNLTRDIEVRFSASNLAIGSTGIATNRKFKTQTGEEKEEILFLDITFFGRTAEIANQYLKKGSKILVEGRLKLDQWTDQSGQKRSKHSLVVESMKMLGGREEEKYTTPVPTEKRTQMPENQNTSPVEEGEIPF